MSDPALTESLIQVPTVTNAVEEEDVGETPESSRDVVVSIDQQHIPDQGNFRFDLFGGHRTTRPFYILAISIHQPPPLTGGERNIDFFRFLKNGEEVRAKFFPKLGNCIIF